MKILYYIPFCVAVINLIYWLAYLIFGKSVTSGMTWIFYILRPEYFLISGILSIICIFIAITILWNFKRLDILNTASVAGNIFYLYLFVNWLAIQ